ncbi:kinetochore component CENP-S-domain-containing protein [Pilobolus umbonatus]|nr:kinetochore component CENP-S-domain-containing protein [Pilobolus umbonatus]
MEDEQQELMTAVWHSVKLISEAEASRQGKVVTPAFVASLAETVYRQLVEIMATDLEAFARHSRRSVISMEDVKLCARRNDSLYEIISEEAKNMSDSVSSKRKKKQ